MARTPRASGKECSDESSSVGETDLRQVQGRAPQGRRARDLQQPETQTAAGIGKHLGDRNRLAVPVAEQAKET